MQIKVYNENGIIKIVKVINGVEYQMFGNVADGEVAVIDVEANISSHAEKDSSGR